MLNQNLIKALTLAGTFILFFGCATSVQWKQDLQSLEQHSLPPDLLKKLTEQQPLSMDDLVSLQEHHVPENLIIRYLKNIETVYNLKLDNIDTLKAAGFSRNFIDYLLSTPELYSYKYYFHGRPGTVSTNTFHRYNTKGITQ